MAHSWEAIFNLGTDVQKLTDRVWQHHDELLQLASLCYETLYREPALSEILSNEAASKSSSSTSLAYLGLYNQGKVLLKRAKKTGSNSSYSQAGDTFRRYFSSPHWFLR